MKRTAFFWFLGIIFILAALVRMAYLEKIPNDCWLDEAGHALDCFGMAEGHGYRIFFPGNCGREPIYTYLVFFLIKLLGPSVWVLRFPASIIGTLTVLFTALVAHKMFQNQMMTLLATGLTAFFRWHVGFSRLAFRANFVPLFTLLCIYLSIRAMDTPSWKRFSLLGLALGINTYTYFSGRMVPAIVAATLFLYWFQHKTPPGQIMVRAAFCCGLAIIISIPLVVYVLNAAEHASARWDMVSVFSMKGNPIVNILKNTLVYLKMFHFHGDIVPRHNIVGKPMLNIVLQALFILGLIACLIKRKAAHLTCLAAIAFLLVPGIMSTKGPASLRTLGIAPFVCIVSALPVTLLQNRIKQWAILLLVVILIILSGSIDMYDYFVVWRHQMVGMSKTDDPVYGQNIGEMAFSKEFLKRHEEKPDAQFMLSPQLFYHATVQMQMYGKVPVTIADLGDLQIDPARETIIGVNLLKRNEWWMRDSKSKSYDHWWTLHYNLRSDQSDMIKRRNYPRNTNFTSESDRFLVDELMKLYPAARLEEFEWYAILTIPGGPKSRMPPPIRKEDPDHPEKSTAPE